MCAPRGGDMEELGCELAVLRAGRVWERVVFWLLELRGCWLYIIVCMWWCLPVHCCPCRSRRGVRPVAVAKPCTGNNWYSILC